MTLADLVPVAPSRPPALSPPPDTARRLSRLSRPRSARTIVSEQDLVIRDLHVAPVANPDHEILRGIDLTVTRGQVHAIMGPNGSGKTTLAYALMGHPAYIVKQGEVLWKGQNLLKLSADKRARLGMFLAFQYPMAIPGLSVASFLRSAINARRLGLNPDPDGRSHGHRPRRHPHGRVPQARQGQDGAAPDGRGGRLALRQRGLLRRREEAPGDAADGRPGARDGDPRRDRLGPGHRRPADRGRGRERHAQPEHGRPGDHPLPAPARLHQAGHGPRPGGRAHHHQRRQRPGPAAREGRLRPDPGRGRPRGRAPATKPRTGRRSRPWRPPARRARR